MFFSTANGEVNGPVSTSAEKAFSQIGLALLFNSAGETVGIEAAVEVGAGLLVAVGSGVSLGGFVGRIVDVPAGAD